MWRAVAAGVSVVLAAAGGVVTVFVTQHSSLGLWVALVALVVLGAALQVAVTVGERRSRRRVVASGPGAVAVGGSAGGIRTRVEGAHGSPAAPAEGDVVASGPGAVSVGGDTTGPVSTDVTDSEGQVPP
jgi:hypothetical protein